MGLLALELSDAGIVAAAKEPRGLLQLEGTHRESPGFALADETELLVGRAAADKASLYPLQCYNAFWDKLNTTPLKQQNRYARNHAEMVYAHLAMLWDRIKGHGDEMVMAVPAFFGRDQLGLILGIAEELGIPLKGMVSLAVAATSKPSPDQVLLHLDMHLHRSEVTFLEQGEQLTQRDSASTGGKGLHHLYTAWVKAIGEEFVRTTRFDPLHQASSEQEVHDRLPAVIGAFQENPSVMFEMVAGSKSYRITLSRELFAAKAEGVFQKIGENIELMRKRHGEPGQPVALQLTHRIAPLPGCREMLATIEAAREMVLEPGAGAFGALDLWHQPFGREVGVTLLTSRPWQGGEAASPAPPRPARPTSHDEVGPTHVLYRTVAYPLSGRPLVVGSGGSQEKVDVRIEGELAGVSRKHCSLEQGKEGVILTDHSTYGTFVDGERVSGTALLRLGQIIRVGTPGEELQLIASAEKDET